MTVLSCAMAGATLELGRANAPRPGPEQPARPFWSDHLRRVVLVCAVVGATLAATQRTSEAKQLPSTLGSLTSLLQPSDRMPVPQWQAALSRHRSTAKGAEKRCDHGDDRACGLRDWQSFLNRLGGAEPWEQLRQVNVYLNRRPYREDAELWRASDYWAEPEEFLARGGDCEDYAIAKYLSLRALGFPAEDLRLSVIYDETRRINHAVLSVDLPGGPVVLDSVTDFVLPWSELGHYRPVYAVNEHATWVSHATDAAPT